MNNSFFGFYLFVDVSFLGENAAHSRVFLHGVFIWCAVERYFLLARHVSMCSFFVLSESGKTSPFDLWLPVFS